MSVEPAEAHGVHSPGLTGSSCNDFLRGASRRRPVRRVCRATPAESWRPHRAIFGLEQRSRASAAIPLAANLVLQQLGDDRSSGDDVDEREVRQLHETPRSP